MSGYYGTIRNTETGERVEINYRNEFYVYGDKPRPSRYFLTSADGRLLEYDGLGGTLGDVRWEWVTDQEGSEA